MKSKAELFCLGLVSFILTITITFQIKTVILYGTAVSTMQSENKLKTQVLKIKERYEEIYSDIEGKEEELKKIRQSVASEDEELKNIEKNIKKYNILVGNTDVSGPGVIISLFNEENNSNISDSSISLIYPKIIAIINELKNAGAEAISINGERIVNSTSILCNENAMLVNGTKISFPIQIMAIGNIELLSTLNRAGGSLEKKSLSEEIKVEFRKAHNIQISKYTGVISFRYAQSFD